MELERIIWAVDPFAEKVMLQRAAAWAIKDLLLRNSKATVQPVYLVNDYSAERLIPQRLVRSFVEKMTSFADDSLSAITHRIPIQNLRGLEVIARPFDSVYEGVEELLGFAHRREADMIVASTRAGRAGGSHFHSFPGSFVATLSENSDIPVLAVNPNWRHSKGIPSLLFPTDFSMESHDWFMRSLDFAKNTSGRLTLFHKIEFPLSQPFEHAARIFPGIREAFYRKITAAQKEASRWEQSARTAGLKTSVIVDSDLSESSTGSLLRYAARRPGAILIAPPLSATLSKNTIRSVLSGNEFPVFFFPTLLRTKARVLPLKRKAS